MNYMTLQPKVTASSSLFNSSKIIRSLFNLRGWIWLPDFSAWKMTEMNWSFNTITFSVDQLSSSGPRWTFMKYEACSSRLWTKKPSVTVKVYDVHTGTGGYFPPTVLLVTRGRRAKESNGFRHLSQPPSGKRVSVCSDLTSLASIIVGFPGWRRDGRQERDTGW